MNPEDIEKLIAQGLPGADIRVMSDDNTHYAALIVSDEFDGKRALARHQLVYRCLGNLMGGDIHALSIRAYTRQEFSELEPGETA